MPNLFAHVPQKDDSLDSLKRQIDVVSNGARRVRADLIQTLSDLPIDMRDLTDLYSQLAQGDNFKSVTQAKLEGDYFHEGVEQYAANEATCFGANSDLKQTIHNIASKAACHANALEVVNTFIAENTPQHQSAYSN